MIIKIINYKTMFTPSLKLAEIHMKKLLIVLTLVVSVSSFAESNECRISNFDHESMYGMDRVISSNKLQKKGLELISSEELGVGDYVETVEKFDRSYHPLTLLGVTTYRYEHVISKVVSIENDKPMLEIVSVKEVSFIGSNDNASKSSSEKIEYNLIKSRIMSLPSCKELNNLQEAL